MTIYGAQVNQRWTGSEPEVGRKWNARDLQAQGAFSYYLFAKYKTQEYLIRI